MIVRGCRLYNQASSYRIWTHGLFAVSHWETNKVVLFLLYSQLVHLLFLLMMIVRFAVIVFFVNKVIILSFSLLKSNESGKTFLQSTLSIFYKVHLNDEIITKYK